MGNVLASCKCDCHCFCRNYSTLANKVSKSQKVKITFNESVIYAFGGSLELADKCQYVSLEVVNTGNRKIIISSYGIKLPDGYKWVILQEPTPAGVTKLPAELDIEQCVSFAWKKDKFIMQLQNLSNYPRDKKVPFFVQDTAGTYYIFKSPKTIQQYLDEAEKHNKKEGGPNHDRTSTPQNDCCRGKHPAGV